MGKMRKNLLLLLPHLPQLLIPAFGVSSSRSPITSTQSPVPKMPNMYTSSNFVRKFAAVAVILLR
jgi:hypothetical protein